VTLSGDWCTFGRNIVVKIQWTWKEIQLIKFNYHPRIVCPRNYTAWRSNRQPFSSSSSLSSLSSSSLHLFLFVDGIYHIWAHYLNTESMTFMPLYFRIAVTSYWLRGQTPKIYNVIDMLCSRFLDWTSSDALWIGDEKSWLVATVCIVKCATFYSTVCTLSSRGSCWGYNDLGSLRAEVPASKLSL